MIMPTTETHHGSTWPESRTAAFWVVNGSTPVALITPTSTAPMTMARPTVAIGGSWSCRSCSAESVPPRAARMKYAAAPTAAARAQSTPVTLGRVALVGSSTSTSPIIATAPPRTVSRPGGRRVVSQTQPTISSGAVYSSSNATPTGRYASAWK